MRKRVRTYRASADGCGAGAGRVAMTDRVPRDDGSAVPDDGFVARDDGYGSLKKSGDDEYRVERWRVLLGRRRLRSHDDESWIDDRANPARTRCLHSI